MNNILDKAVNLYNLEGYKFDQVAGHDGGRNLVYVCSKNEVKEYIESVIPDEYKELKKAISVRLEKYRELPMDVNSYGLVHFDFSDGNYHVDMSNGNITTFDFDNCINCWYMFDLAHLWTHGVGWYQFEPDGNKRLEYMKNDYFACILEGYRSETDISEALLDKLNLFIDMVLIEGVIDEFECAAREGEKPDPEDIDDYVICLVEDIPYAGVGVNIPDYMRNSDTLM